LKKKILSLYEKLAVERVVPKLSGLSFCKKGSKSELATKRYNEIVKNISG
jgi:hypothetical protein